MIIGCVIVYNDEVMLPGCLESLVGQVDRLVVVDGAFATFPVRNGRAESTDLTEEIARAYGAEWVDPPESAGRRRVWGDEMEKRNAYLVGEEGDWYMPVDSDERVWGRLPAPVDGAHYAFQVNVWDRWVWVPRMFQHRGQMRYEGAHNAVWSGERLLHLEGAERVDPGTCRLLHFDWLRPAWQQRAKKEHYARRTPLERGYRDTHGI